MDSAATPASVNVSAVVLSSTDLMKTSLEAQAVSTNPNSNPKTSRWSDGTDANGEEPPQKKVKNDIDSSTTAMTTATATLSTTGYGETQASLAYAAATVASSFTVPVYGTYQQQTASYQNYGTQYQAAYGAAAFAPANAKGSSALFYKTKLCTKFKIGACTFNERCHFAHGVDDLRKPAPGWESVVGLSGTASNMQARAKTRPCRYFAEGNCPYGDRCNFLHGNEEPQKLWSATGAYATSGVQVPASTTDYQTYSIAPGYTNGVYTDPNQVVSTNTTQSGLAAYAVQTENSAATNANLYGNAAAVNPYGITPSASNGTASTYNYWNTTSVNPSQSYIQYNQTATWMPNYSMDGYSNRANESAVTTYSQDHLQQQQSAATMTYMQSGSYPGAQ